MRRDFLGRCGRDLTDLEYIAALAALGTIQSRGTQQYSGISSPDEVADAIRNETLQGARTARWRGAYHVLVNPVIGIAPLFSITSIRTCQRPGRA